MKIIIRTLKGTRFEIQVKPEDSVADVKKNIETVLGASAYPAAQQMLIHKGKLLKDETTMEENNVSEKFFIAIMMAKSKPASTVSSTASTGLKAQKQHSAESRTRSSRPMLVLLLAREGIPKTGSLEFLRHTQQYKVLQPLVQADRSLARPIVDEIREQNPQLMQKILDNKTDFRLLVLGLPLVGEESDQMAQPQEQRDEGGDGGNQMEQPENEIELTREEKKSIQRLEAIGGFERSFVVKVFLDFKKDERLAATFLLDHRIHFPKFP